MRTAHTIPALGFIHTHHPDKEVIERRTAISKTFQVAKDTFELHAGIGIIHHPQNGKMVEIDLNIKTINGKTVVTHAPYDVEIFTNKVGYRLSSPQANYEMELVKIGDKQVDNSRITSYYEGHQLFWQNVYDGIDAKIMLFADKAETYLQLRDEHCPKKFTWKITDSGNLNFSTTGGDMNKDRLEIIVTQTEKINGVYYYEEHFTGRVASIADKKTRIKKWFDNPAYPVVIDPTVTINIAVFNDDGMETQNTATLGGFWNSAIMNVFKAGGFAYNPGFRFQTVNVPVGATITSAKLKIKLKGTANQVVKIWGDKVGNAAAWSDSSRPSQITKTAVSTTKVFTSGSGGAGVFQSLNVTGQIASIVGLGAWASNNAIRLGMLSATGASTLGIYDKNTSAPNAAQLIITYTGGASTNSNFFMFFK